MRSAAQWVGTLQSLPGPNAHVTTLWDDISNNGWSNDNPDGTYSLKTTSIQFINTSSIKLTAGTGHDVVVANTGTNKFTSAALGSLDVTGGSGSCA